MYEIDKFKFINPSQIATIEVVESVIITKEKEAGTMEVVVTMSNNKFYKLNKPKKDAVAIVNQLMGMINTANNPFLSLPKQAPEAPVKISRIPSDGAGAGQHKVDPMVYPPEELDKFGYPIKGSKAWPVGHPQHPDMLAKAEQDKWIEDEVAKRLAEQQTKTASQTPVVIPPAQTPPVPAAPTPAPVPVPSIANAPASQVPMQIPVVKTPPPPAKERTGEMNIPPELQGIPEAVEVPKEESPFG